MFLLHYRQTQELEFIFSQSHTQGCGAIKSTNAQSIPVRGRFAKSCSTKAVLESEKILYIFMRVSVAGGCKHKRLNWWKLRHGYLVKRGNPKTKSMQGNIKFPNSSSIEPEKTHQGVEHR